MTTKTEIVPAAKKLAGLEQVVTDPKFQKRLVGILPKAITPTRFALTALSIVGRDSNLLNCTQVSLVRCMLQAASVGLEVGNELGHAYLVPFRDRKTNTSVCTLILGYRGLVQLLYRSDQVSGVEAQVVREGDRFSYAFGLTPALEHRPDSGVDDAVTHAYAILRLRDGNKLFDVMTRGEIEAIRSRSRAGASGPWVTDYAEMAKKTVLRRLAKLAPMSVEDQRLVTADEHADANLDQSGVFAPEVLAPSLSVEPELTEDEEQAKAEYEAAMQEEMDEQLDEMHQATLEGRGD